jgi:hypothetical protein
MILYEVFLVDGSEGTVILSDEVKQETGAQVFTPEEAALVGLEGIPEDPENRPRVLIACSPSNKQFIASRLEASAAVGTFKLHELG